MALKLANCFVVCSPWFLNAHLYLELARSKLVPVLFSSIWKCALFPYAVAFHTFFNPTVVNN